MDLNLNKNLFSMNFCWAGEEDKIPPVLDLYVENKLDLSDINMILELYNIKQFFEKYESFDAWGEEKYEKYRKISEKIGKEVSTYFINFKESQIVENYDKCDAIFYDDFWILFYKYEVYKKINEDNFERITDALKMSPFQLLEDKRFVKHFDNLISQKLKKPKYSARFFIEYYLSSDINKNKYHIPHSLSSEDVYDVVKSYVEGEYVNPKLLELIFNGKKCDMLDITDKLRYLARERYDKYFKDNKNSFIGFSIKIIVKELVDKSEDTIQFDGKNLILKIDNNGLQENLDYSTILNNFIYQFEFVDLNMQCNLTSVKLKQYEPEQTFSTHGKNMYACGYLFNLFNKAANVQLYHYSKLLNKKNIRIEDVIKWFFEEYLLQEFNVENFKCLMPQNTDSILAKTQRVVSVMDGIKKRFKLYCDEGEINNSYYSIVTNVERYSDIPSLIINKYAYIQNDELNREIEDLFSDKLIHDKKFKDEKNRTLFGVVKTQNINISDIPKYAIEEIEWLIERKILCNKNGELKIDEERAQILKILCRNKVICLQYFKSDVLKEMILSGDLRVGSTLLSETEWNYFNYVLNNSEYTNGPAIRNKYSHEDVPTDENQIKQDYITILKMIIIMVLKIKEDFDLREKIKIHGDFYEEK